MEQLKVMVAGIGIPVSNVRNGATKEERSMRDATSTPSTIPNRGVLLFATIVLTDMYPALKIGNAAAELKNVNATLNAWNSAGDNLADGM